MAKVQIFDLGVSSLDADDDGPRLQVLDEPAIRIGGGSGGGGSVADFGANMLMNDRKKTNMTPADEIDMGDLDNLENELNALTGSAPSKKTAFMSDLPRFGGGGGGDSTPSAVRFSSDGDAAGGGVPSLDESNAIKIQIAKDINASQANEGTWDGFKTFNDIPVSAESSIEAVPKMTREELMRKKFELVRKLESLEAKGVKLTKHYTMESSLAEMEGEYEMIVAEREKQNSIKFQGKMLLACVNAVEFLNGKFDPFDFKLDGWAESVNENLDDYNEIFEELHEKYRSRTKIAPELKLLFQLGGSAVMLHMTNSMFKSAMPGMDDIMRQNPELAHQFQEAAVRSMSQQNPGFGNFMGAVMSGRGGGGGGAGGGGGGGKDRAGNNMSGAGGLPPMTGTDRSRPVDFSAPINRPDIGMSRGIPQFDDGENMENRFGSMSTGGDMPPPPGSSSSRTANLVRGATTSARPVSSAPSTRPDMKGPANIDDLLAGLKPKTSGPIAAPQLMPQRSPAPQQRMVPPQAEPRAMTPRAMTPRQPTPPLPPVTQMSPMPQIQSIQSVAPTVVLRRDDDDRVSVLSMNDDGASFLSRGDGGSKSSGRGRRRSDKNRVAVSLDI
jgi:hypothetical protein